MPKCVAEVGVETERKCKRVCVCVCVCGTGRRQMLFNKPGYEYVSVLFSYNKPRCRVQQDEHRQTIELAQ